MTKILDNVNGKRDGFLVHHFCNHASKLSPKSTSDRSDSQTLDTIEADLNTLLNQPIKDRADAFYNEDLSDQTTALLSSTRPWEKDPEYFQHVHVSALALLKMSIHARSGGDIEIMGMLTGKIVKNGIVVMDVYPLPVEGTETRVNAQAEGYEFMVQYMSSLEKANRNEKVVGWYHSHPGYGCWLSGIDVSTQSLNQQFQDPYLAIVIDPHRTQAHGIVEIGAFRTYPQEYIDRKAENYGNLGSLVVSPDPNVNGKDGNKVPQHGQRKKTDTSNIPEEKVKDFGAHNNKYYSLSVNIFRTEMDHLILQNLWNKFWIKNLLGECQKSEERTSVESYIERKVDLFQDKISSFDEGVTEENKGPANSRPGESGLHGPRHQLREGRRHHKFALQGHLASSPQTTFNIMSQLNNSQLSPFTRANLLSKMSAKEPVPRNSQDSDGSDSEMNDVDSESDSHQDDESETLSIAQRLAGSSGSTKFPRTPMTSATTRSGKSSTGVKYPVELRKIGTNTSDANLTSEEHRDVQRVAAEAGRNLMSLKLQEILFLNE